MGHEPSRMSVRTRPDPAIAPVRFREEPNEEEDDEEEDDNKDKNDEQEGDEYDDQSDGYSV
jgi:hypothetical protein